MIGESRWEEGGGKKQNEQESTSEEGRVQKRRQGSQEVEEWRIMGKGHDGCLRRGVWRRRKD